MMQAGRKLFVRMEWAILCIWGIPLLSNEFKLGAVLEHQGCDQIVKQLPNLSSFKMKMSSGQGKRVKKNSKRI